jgi:hypothetical protein
MRLAAANAGMRTETSTDAGRISKLLNADISTEAAAAML